MKNLGIAIIIIALTAFSGFSQSLRNLTFDQKVVFLKDKLELSAVQITQTDQLVVQRQIAIDDLANCYLDESEKTIKIKAIKEQFKKDFTKVLNRDQYRQFETFLSELTPKNKRQ